MGADCLVFDCISVLIRTMCSHVLLPQTQGMMRLAIERGNRSSGLTLGLPIEVSLRGNPVLPSKVRRNSL